MGFAPRFATREAYMEMPVFATFTRVRSSALFGGADSRTNSTMADVPAKRPGSAALAPE